METPELRAAFMQNRLIKATPNRPAKPTWRSSYLGDMNENSFMVQLGWFTPQEIATARQEQGVVGDLAGYSFSQYSGQTRRYGDEMTGSLGLAPNSRGHSLRHRYRLRKYESDGDPHTPGLSMCWLPAPQRPFGH